MYRYDKSENYKRANMFDDGKHNDGTAGDGVYGVAVDAKEDTSTIEFYITAQNAKSITYEPKNYMFTSMKADLIMLNK